jgi:hypothetical protein
LAKTQLCKAFMNGNCSNPNCTYAHGEAELMKPPNFKKKLCHWHAKGQCRNGDKCGFAHSIRELADPPGETEAEEVKQWISLNESKKFSGRQVDWDASTVAPSSLHETDISVMSRASRGSMPDESLHRMMAGRGSAPLQDQVASMGMAIADLQAKLSQVEGKMSQTQVGQMQQSLSQLTNQYGNMEAECQSTGVKKTLNPAAATFTPSKPLPEPSRSDGITNRRANSVVAAQPQARKPQPKSNPVKSEKILWHTIGTRSLLAVFTISLMVAIELYFVQ